MKFIDLYCGAGGFTEGLKKAGHNPILGVDYEKIALKSYKANHHCEVWNKDVLKIEIDDLPEADFLIGSPPCQDFSSVKANKPKLPDTKCLNHFIKLGRNYKFFIGENVPMITKHLDGLPSQNLQATSFGLWHKRERCFFGVFPRVKRLTRNQSYFPTPRASNRNTSKQISLRNVRTKPLHKLKSHSFELSYPWYVSRWLMGFPEDYIFEGANREKERQIGNAVCPPVAEAIGKTITQTRGGA